MPSHFTVQSVASAPTSRAWAALLLVAAVMAGCASPKYRAPVEERGRVAGTAPAPSGDVKPMPGAENAGKPGYVTVKPGDTLIRIAIDAGQSWRDVARWNNLEKPDMIEAGQVLRVAPPPSEVAVAAKPIAAPRVEARPLDAKPAPVSTPTPATAAPGPSASTTGPASTPVAAPAPSAPAPAPAANQMSTAGAGGDESVSWAWPAKGNVGATFEEPRMKGVAIVGQAGDPVLAAADGRVVYVGSSIRGYGNLVIVKHNATFLTAYGHNRAVLVKEDQAVRKGQRIAEMGSTDADRVQLHFEIRRNGVPIDPIKMLPAR